MLIRKKRLEQLEMRIGVLENTILDLKERIDRDRLQCNLEHLDRETIEKIVGEKIAPALHGLESNAKPIYGKGMRIDGVIP